MNKLSLLKLSNSCFPIFWHLKKTRAGLELGLTMPGLDDVHLRQ